MDEEKFKKIYFENSNIEAARKLKIAPSTLASYVKRLGISKPRGRKKGQTKFKFLS